MAPHLCIQEYINCGKGRDMGFDSINGFNFKAGICVCLCLCMRVCLATELNMRAWITLCATLGEKLWLMWIVATNYDSVCGLAAGLPCTREMHGVAEIPCARAVPCVRAIPCARGMLCRRNILDDELCASLVTHSQTSQVQDPKPGIPSPPSSSPTHTHTRSYARTAGQRVSGSGGMQ